LGEVKVEKVASAEAAPRQRLRERPQPTREAKLHKLYLFGVNRERFEQLIREMGLYPAVTVVDKLGEASLFVTAKHHYRRKPQTVKDAEDANLPIFVLRSNTPNQIRQLLNTIHGTPEHRLERQRAS